MQLTQSSQWANPRNEHKQPFIDKNKLENLNNQQQHSHLQETSRRLRNPGGNFLTQEYNDVNWEDTVQPKKPQKKRVQTNSSKENGYLGEIRFESRQGVKSEFHVFADNQIGIKQNTQTILVDQKWDEDIETDESCKQNAIFKCMKQLSIAIRHQRKGIDPTKICEYDYQDLEQKFAQENIQIAFDYQNHEIQQQQQKYSQQSSQEEEQLIVSMSVVNQQMDRMLQNNRNCNNYTEMVKIEDRDNIFKKQQHLHSQQQQNNIPPFEDTLLQQSSPSYRSDIFNQSQQHNHQQSCSQMSQISAINEQLFNEDNNLRQNSSVVLISQASCDNSQSNKHQYRDGYFFKELPTLEDIIEMETILDSPVVFFEEMNSSNAENRSFQGRNLEQEYHDIDDFCRNDEDINSKELNQQIEQLFPSQESAEDHLVIMSIQSQDQIFNSRIQFYTQQTYPSAAYQFSQLQDVSYSI